MSAAWRFFFGRDPPWQDVCERHDLAYWQGGSRYARFRADCVLLHVIAHRGHPWFAMSMFVAVRLGGHPLLPFSWRWGYGWSYPRRYTKN